VNEMQDRKFTMIRKEKEQRTIYRIF